MIDESYNDVPSRIVEFRAKHPEGTLQAEVIHWPTEELPFLAVRAYAYRTPEDERPGIGLAYERVPGKTNFTRDSELQNAETSAWGRAIVAVGAADTRKGIASAEEVQARSASPGPESSGKGLEGSVPDEPGDVPVAEGDAPAPSGVVGEGASPPPTGQVTVAELVLFAGSRAKAVAALNAALELTGKETLKVGDLDENTTADQRALAAAWIAENVKAKL